MTRIFVTWTAAGYHSWPDSPDRAYLRDTHRHLFNFRVELDVKHADREVEFHDVLDLCRNLTPADKDYGEASCEQIASWIASEVERVVGAGRHVVVQVSEDGECGTLVDTARGKTLTTVAKTFTFDAAHQLPNHNGKCANLHGHTYRVEVCVAGDVNRRAGESSEGMVLDFCEIKDVWKRDLEPLLDHRNLNESIGESCWPTTAENLAAYILHGFRAAGVLACEVSVWETPTSRATVRI